MRKFAFVTRHQPTPAQTIIAARAGIALIPVGDRDGFTFDPTEFGGEYDGVIVVHPAAALRASACGWAVGIWENANRAPEGAPPRFEAVSLHLYANGAATPYEVCS